MGGRCNLQTEIEGRTYDNEGLNANIGLVVTSAGAVLIDSGASFQSARKIHEAAREVTSQPVKWVINTGDQDHRWLGNGYFSAQGIETIAHAAAQADMRKRSGEHLEGLKVLKERLADFGFADVGDVGGGGRAQASPVVIPTHPPLLV
jgi:glyoxylase-like metal-dependent hydrolase (beta-lactamase superfamily II)